MFSNPDRPADSTPPASPATPRRGRPQIDLTDQVLGRLTVLGRDTTRPDQAQAHWRCRCECGAEVVHRGQSLRSEDGPRCCPACLDAARLQARGEAPLPPPVEWRELPPTRRRRYRAGSDGAIESGNLRGDPAWRRLKPIPIRSGHLRVGIAGRNTLVHRLVATAFLGQPEHPDQLVRHLNDRPGDNRVRNLCWGWQSDNSTDAVVNGRMPLGSACRGAKLSEAQALEVVAMVRAGMSQRAVARRFGICQPNVSEIVNGFIWSHATGIERQCRRNCRRVSPRPRYGDQAHPDQVARLDAPRAEVPINNPDRPTEPNDR